MTGQRDLKNLNAISKHASSNQHLNRTIHLSMVGKSNIAVVLDSGYALSIARHNAEVLKNREIHYQKLSTVLKYVENVNSL